MSLNSYDASIRVFIRGLTNLKGQLIKAEAHAAASGGNAAALVEARLPQDARAGDVARDTQYDLHTYTLAAQVHWAAEGARLAVGRMVGAQTERAANDARGFADLYQRIDTTIAHLREVAATDIEVGASRPVVIEHRRGSVSADGGQFLLGYAIPHFFHHVTTAYNILRSHGVPLTMADFLGDWGTA